MTHFFLFYPINFTYRQNKTTETDAFFHVSLEIGFHFGSNHHCWIGIGDQIAL